MPNAEFRGQESVDKGNIVVNAADLEYFLPAQTQSLVPFAFGVFIVAFVPFLAEPAGVPAVLDVAQAARCRACMD